MENYINSYLRSNKNNKGRINVRNDDGSCKCSVDRTLEDGYQYVINAASAYKYYKEPKTWNEARKVCENENAHLAILDSATEKQELLVFDLTNKLNRIESTIRAPTTDHHFWLGAHDQFQEGDCTTVLGDPLDYAPWSKTCYDTVQPDNGGAAGNNNCGSLDNKCEEMDDLRCDVLLPFYCEKPHTCL